MAVQPATRGTDSSERYSLFNLRKAVKMIKTEGQDFENTTLLHDSEFCWTGVEKTEEYASNSHWLAFSEARRQGFFPGTPVSSPPSSV